MLDYEARLRAVMHPVEDLDWNDARETRQVTGEVLRALSADKALLGDVIRSVPDDPERLQHCEREFDMLQLVLYDSPSGDYRIRLHVMPDKMHDYPHGHRYAFGSMVLHGVLNQTLFYPLDFGKDPIPPDAMAITNFNIHPGESYAFSHPVVHQVHVASAPVVTLFVRSKPFKDQASNFDTSTGQHWWQRGRATGQSEGKHITMTRGEFAEAITTLEGLSII